MISPSCPLVLYTTPLSPCLSGVPEGKHQSADHFSSILTIRPEGTESGTLKTPFRVSLYQDRHSLNSGITTTFFLTGSTYFSHVKFSGGEYGPEIKKHEVWRQNLVIEQVFSSWPALWP